MKLENQVENLLKQKFETKRVSAIVSKFYFLYTKI